MKARVLLAVGLVVVTILSFAGSVPAQTPARKVIEVTLTSFKFEPSQIQITEGETVVIRLKNADQFGRPHNMAARYLTNIPLTVRGDATQGTEEERKFVRVDAGKQAEFEFVAQGPGSYAFICSLFSHAINGMAGALIVKPQQSK